MSRPRLSDPCAFVLAIAVLVGASAPAGAQQGWSSSPALLSSVPVALIVGGQEPKVAVSADGNALAVWTEVPPSTTVRAVRAAGYNQATGVWTPAITLFASATQAAQDVRLAGDSTGNAVAAWSTFSVGVGNPTNFARAARYSASTGAWTEIVLPATDRSATPVVAMNAAGDAVIVWRDLAGAGYGIHAVRYSHATDTWSGDERPAGNLVDGALLDAAMDDSGSIHLVWRGSNQVQSSHYSAAGGAWSSVVDLGPYTDIAVVAPRVAMNGAGDAVATWESGGGIQAALRARSAGAWAAPSLISGGSGQHVTSRPAVDPAGGIVVAWLRTDTNGRSGAQARRFAPGSGWSPIANLFTDGGQLPPSVAVAMDRAGNAFVLTSRYVATPAESRLLAARYAVSTDTWTVSSGLSPAGQFAVLSDVAVDWNGNAVAVWFQSSGAQNTQALRWDATPAPPTAIAVTPGSSSLTVGFSVPSASDPAFAATGLAYSIDDGALWVSPFLPSGHLVIPGLIDGVTYTLRLRLTNAAGWGPASQPLQVRSGTDIAPSNLRIVSRTGNRVTLAWTPPAAGLVPTSYAIEGGFWGQSQVLATVASNGAATQLTLDVPYGAYFVRVAGFSNGRRLGTSPSLLFAVEANPEPSAPVGLLGSSAGSTLALSWRTTWEGASPTGVRLFVFGAITASLDLPMSESFVFPAVPPGTYTFTVSSTAGSGVGPPTAPVTLTFPGACAGAPSAPAAFHASTRGGTVYLDWLPPSSGEAVTSYVVSVSGAFTGSFPSSSRSFTSPAPPGSYTLSVRAVGPCGTSAATTPTTVVVP